MSEAEWSLQEGKVHIWEVSLPLPERAVAHLKEYLSARERERSAKFHFLHDQSSYVSARGALRVILASYLRERPDSLTFGYGTYGKPFLTHPPTARRMAFNLSHCREMAVIGVASGRNIGVDVETVRHFPELEHIVERHFSREERASIESASEKTIDSVFFRIWTRREAAAKARGLDLSAALSELEIPFYPPGLETRLRQKGGTWLLHDLQFGPTCVGAVCVEGETCDVAFRNFDSLLGDIA
jgi:4'-phosphopantetheinyl transferase